MDVTILFYKGAAEKTFHNIINVYSKDDMFCLRDNEGYILKIPLMHILYVKHKHGKHIGSDGHINQKPKASEGGTSLMYIVKESYDGKVNIDICANIESALYKKKEHIDNLKENFNYELIKDEDRFFSAEVNEMLYTIEIRQESIFNINIL